MEKKYGAVGFIFVFLFSLSLASAVTWRHDGTDNMILDDDGNLTVTGDVAADYFKGNGSLLTDISADTIADNAALGGNVTVGENLSVNGDLSIVGNMSTTGTGFFGFLGSLVSRITGLFVQNINFSGKISSSSGSLNITASSGNVDTTGNVTADYFKGNGSLLTDVVAASVNDGVITNTKIAADAVNTTQIVDGTIRANDMAADSINGTHIVNNVGLRNTKITGNLNVTQNVTIGGMKVYEESGEIIFDY